MANAFSVFVSIALLTYLADAVDVRLPAQRAIATPSFSLDLIPAMSFWYVVDLAAIAGDLARQIGEATPVSALSTSPDHSALHVSKYAPLTTSNCGC